MLPLAMLAGIIFHNFFGIFSFLTPYLIFCMLLVPFCKLSLQNIKFVPLHGWLLAVQIVGSLIVYGIFRFIDPVTAQGVFICVLAPTATAAAVITGMLGGNIALLVSFTLFSNICVALVSPLLFTLIGGDTGQPFWASFLLILRQVIPLLILPCVCALALRKVAPGIHRKLLNSQSLAFYLWAIGLMITMAKTTNFVLAQDDKNFSQEFMIAGFSLVVCLLQFMIGKKIGRHFGDTIAGGQALGQKNTILAIWMAQVYLNPLSSIGPASYVLWQNSLNSLQLWLKQRRKSVNPTSGL